MHVRLFIQIIFFVSFSTCLAGQAAASLDSSTVKIGQPIFLKITVPQHAGEIEKINFSSWDSIIPPDDRTEKIVWKKTGENWTGKMKFFAFDTGKYVLPAADIFLKNGEKTQTPPLVLEVLPTVFEGDQLAENKPIRKEPTTLMDYIWYILVPFIWLILAIAVWFFISRKKKKANKPVSQIVEQPPRELALKKLEALRKKQLWQSGQLKNYYSELTFIFREFLEKQYRIPALENTSDEIISHLKKTNFPENQLPALRQILQAADLAKFAKADPPEDFHEKAMENVYWFVEGKIIEVHK